VAPEGACFYSSRIVKGLGVRHEAALATVSANMLRHG
jgi:hypothetical protein